MRRAPDGTCTKEKIPKRPKVPDYEDRMVYNTKAVNNNKYPKKRYHEVLVFVGDDMKNKKQRFSRTPKYLESLQKVELEIYSEDQKTTELLEIFLRLLEIVSMFDDKKPYFKHLILNANNISKDRKIMRSYGIDYKDAPAIYLYNEVTKDLKKFKLFKKIERQCDMLERLIIFIADGDCGLLSYLNYMHDPHYGMKFIYDPEKKNWKPNLLRGMTPNARGTGMCSLIDIDFVPNSYECKKLQQ